jgi:anti-anti-sigma regulatory factor
MEHTQTIIGQQNGVLIVQAVGLLDEKTSPPIFAQILKYTHEAPQIVVIDLSNIIGAKTAFLNGVIEVHNYLVKNGGDMVLVK